MGIAPEPLGNPEGIGQGFSSVGNLTYPYIRISSPAKGRCEPVADKEAPDEKLLCWKMVVPLWELMASESIFSWALL
jgi:hypothetical protein